MGYYTKFDLKVHEGELRIDQILEQVEFEFEGLDYAIDLEGYCIDERKWYGHEEDMKRLSKKFPNTVFVLHGEGEENDDVWYKYFKNGKMQDCYVKSTFDEYDEEKLK